MLQNAYLDARIGVDPAENEPGKKRLCRGPPVTPSGGSAALATQLSFPSSVVLGDEDLPLVGRFHYAALSRLHCGLGVRGIER